MTDLKHKVPPLRFAPGGMTDLKHKVPPLRFASVRMTDLWREFAGLNTKLHGKSSASAMEIPAGPRRTSVMESPAQVAY